MVSYSAEKHKQDACNSPSLKEITSMARGTVLAP